jgi:hypothetical protein
VAGRRSADGGCGNDIYRAPGAGRYHSCGTKFLLSDCSCARCRLQRWAGLATGGELGSANASMPNDGSQFLNRHRHRQKKPQVYPVRKYRRSLSLLRP